jgi:hypothetical protein
MGPAVCAVVSFVRSYGHLPAPDFQRLKHDAFALNLNALEYIQLAWHQRYQQLAALDRRRKRGRPRRRPSLAALRPRP